MKLTVFDKTEKQIIRINKNGLITLSAEFVHENKLDGKHIVLLKDEDDKEKRFLYLTYNLNGNGTMIKKSKNGMYQLSNKQLAEHYEGRQKSIKFSFLRRISDKNEPYFLFEKKA